MAGRKSSDSSSERRRKLPLIPFFGQSSTPSDPEFAPTSQGTKRITTPSSQRLTAITEDGTANSIRAPTIPPKNPLRNSTLTASPPPPRWSGRRISRFSEDTTRTAPPAYEWVPESMIDEVPNPADDEKLARLRRGETHKSRRRGGWWRLIAIAIVVLLVIVGLAVGLGVGLSRKKHNGSNDDQSSGSTSGSDKPPVFPLGSFVIPTTLKSTQTACTSVSDIWRCNPPFPFQWIITNTSSTYASNATTLTTSSSGVPANLSISTSGNPFSLTFTNQSMTYVSSAASPDSAYLTFNFNMSKSVYPSKPITTNGQNAECFFYSTMFTGTMYLSAQSTLGNVNLTSASSDTPWPYALNITQTAVGGQDVPDCFETGSGAHVAVATESNADVCLCAYNNH